MTRPSVVLAVLTTILLLSPACKKNGNGTKDDGAGAARPRPKPEPAEPIVSFFGYHMDMSKTDVIKHAKKDGFTFEDKYFEGGEHKGTLAGTTAFAHWIFTDDKLKTLDARFAPDGEPALEDTKFYKSLVTSLGKPDADSRTGYAIWRKGQIQITVEKSGHTPKDASKPIIEYNFAAQVNRSSPPPTPEEKARWERERKQKEAEMEAATKRQEADKKSSP